MENGKPYITTVRVRPARREQADAAGVEWPHHTHGLVEVTVCGVTRAIVDALTKPPTVLYIEPEFGGELGERNVVRLVRPALALMDASRKVPA